MLPQLGQPRGQLHAGEAGAVRKGAAADGGHRVRYVDLPKLRAAPEGVDPDGAQGAGEGDALEPGALDKGVFADGGDTLRDGDGDGPIIQAPGEHPVFNGEVGGGVGRGAGAGRGRGFRLGLRLHVPAGAAAVVERGGEKVFAQLGLGEGVALPDGTGEAAAVVEGLTAQIGQGGGQVNAGQQGLAEGLVANVSQPLGEADLGDMGALKGPAADLPQGGGQGHRHGRGQLPQEIKGLVPDFDTALGDGEGGNKGLAQVVKGPLTDLGDAGGDVHHAAAARVGHQHAVFDDKAAVLPGEGRGEQAHHQAGTEEQAQDFPFHGIPPYQTGWSLGGPRRSPAPERRGPDGDAGKGVLRPVRG